MSEINCPFRHRIRTTSDGEVATCRLLQQVTGLADSDDCDVPRESCEVCSESLLDKVVQLNDVVTSGLYHACSRGLQREQPNSSYLRRLQESLEIAISEPPVTARPVTYRCDVVLCCTDSGEESKRAIASVLQQDGVCPILHLVDDGGGGREVIGQFANRADVIIHRNPISRGLFATLHDLVPKLRTPFVALQDVQSTSRPNRLHDSLKLMDEQGLEIVAAGLATPANTFVPRRPGSPYQRCFPPHSLLFRRATLVDMGGVSERSGDEDAELVFRASVEGRAIGWIDDPLVDAKDWIPNCLGPEPRYEAVNGSLRKHARGYPQKRIACDVVLPFRGHLDFTEEALRSVLEQEAADVVVHLIDDATPQDTSEFMDRWRSHPGIRTYRNSTNIGQFASFNNVVPWLETNLVAVQDADDISLPSRIHVAGNALGLADADLFGAWVALFGDNEVLVPSLRQATRRERRARPEYYSSGYPSRSRLVYCLQNPSLVMRAAAFRDLGGFADFGELDRNRTGLDTEFQSRAFLAGARCAVSRDILVRYRVHGDSATQNAKSGWGSVAKAESTELVRRRRAGYQRGTFDPRSFGALRGQQGITQRL